MKKILVIVAVALLLGVAVFTALSATNEEQEFQASGDNYMQYAEEQLAKGGYGSAVDYITAAIKVRPDVERYLRLADVYKEAGNGDMYENALNKAIELYPADGRAYMRLAQFFYDGKAYSRSAEVLLKAQAAGCLDDDMRELYYKAAYHFNVVSVAFTEAQTFYGEYARVAIGEEISYVNTGMMSYYGIFKAASPATSSIIAADDGDHWSYFSADHLRYMECEEPVKQGWAITDNLALVQKDSGYSFLNTHGTEVLGPYEEACSFNNGVAAVKSGGVWYLIGTNGKAITETTFTRVLINEDNICCSGGIIFADAGSGYDMYGTDGKLIAETHFEDAQMFYSGDYAAVKVNTKWGYVDKEGKMFIDPKYEDARSFGRSIAAVCEGGLWGFITTQERVVIDYQFQDAKVFSEAGLAPVKTEDGWVYIQIYS